MRAASPSSGVGIGAPDAEQVILGVDALEREPLVRVEVALEDPPDAAVGLRHLSDPCPLVGALGRRRERARFLERGERGVGEGGVAVELGGVGRDLVQDVLGGEGGHAGCTTPGWNAGFPMGIGTGQSGVSGPGVSPRARAASTSIGTSRAVSRAVSRRAPTLIPSCASTIPPAPASDRRASPRRSRPASRACPCSSRRSPAPARRATSCGEVGEMPPRNPPPSSRRRCTSSARSMSASTAALRDLRMPQVRVPVHLDLVPGVLDPLEQRGMLLDPLPEHEERGGHAGRLERVQHRGRPARVRPVVEGQRKHAARNYPDHR